MTLFEWYEEGHAQLALEVGVITDYDFAKFIQYKRFLDVRQTVKSQAEALVILAEEFNSSESAIWRAISLFRNGQDCQ